MSDYYKNLQQDMANIRRKDIGEFMYYRAERLDQLGTLVDTEAVDAAIQVADRLRMQPSVSNAEYNTWNKVKNYLLFMRCQMANDNYLGNQRVTVEDSSRTH